MPKCKCCGEPVINGVVLHSECYDRLAKDTNVPDKNADLGKMVPTVDRLADILSHYFMIGDSYTFELTRDKQAFEIGTMTFEDFSEWDEENVGDLAEYIMRKLQEPMEEHDEV